MMKVLLILFFCFLIVGFNAQITYEVKDNNANYANARIQLGISFETGANWRSMIMTDWYANYIFNDQHLELSCSFYTPSFMEERKDFYSDNKSDNEFERFRAFEIGGTYNFSDLTKKRKIKVFLGSRMIDSKTRVNYRALVDGDRRERIGGRLGLYKYTQSINSYDGEDHYWELEDGTFVPIVDDESSEHDIERERDTPKGPDLYSAEQHVCTYFGMAYHSTVGLEVKTEEFGRRKKYYDFLVYSDILLATSSDIQNLGYNGNLYDLTENNHGIELRKFGYRIGLRIAKRETHAIAYLVEILSRPTYTGSGLVYRASVSYSFGKSF